MDWTLARPVLALVASRSDRQLDVESSLKMHLTMSRPSSNQSLSYRYMQLYGFDQRPQSSTGYDSFHSYDPIWPNTVPAVDNGHLKRTVHFYIQISQTRSLTRFAQDSVRTSVHWWPLLSTSDTRRHWAIILNTITSVHSRLIIRTRRRRLVLLVRAPVLGFFRTLNRRLLEFLILLVNRWRYAIDIVRIDGAGRNTGVHNDLRVARIRRHGVTVRPVVIGRRSVSIQILYIRRCVAALKAIQ